MLFESPVKIAYTIRVFTRDGSFLFQNRNRRNILNATLLTRKTARKQWGFKHNITFNYLGMMQMSRQSE